MFEDEWVCHCRIISLTATRLVLASLRTFRYITISNPQLIWCETLTFSNAPKLKVHASLFKPRERVRCRFGEKNLRLFGPFLAKPPATGAASGGALTCRCGALAACNTFKSAMPVQNPGIQNLQVNLASSAAAQPRLVHKSLGTGSLLGCSAQPLASTH